MENWGGWEERDAVKHLGPPVMPWDCAGGHGDTSADSWEDESTFLIALHLYG